jgi:hypothetical protein
MLPRQPVKRTWAKSLTARERIEKAKAKMERVLDHFLYLLELHANNTYVVYSPILSSQIPASYAANAFNVFQRSMHQIAIVRLCALWDGVDPDKENVPTVVALIDDEEVIRMLADDTRQQWADNPISLSDGSDDPAIAAAEMKAARDAEIRFGDQEAAKCSADLRQAIANTQAILASPLLSSVMNIRDKHLAHSLEATYREKRGPVSPMKYGDEADLINQSCPIVEQFFCWVNGKSFSLANSRTIDDENASALWHACKFQDIT